MDDNREALKSMLNNLINDRREEASLDFHKYATSKMKDISGIGATAPDEPEDNIVTDEPSDTSTDDETATIEN